MILFLSKINLRNLMSEKIDADSRIVKTVRSLQKTQQRDINHESTADSSDDKSDKPNSGIPKPQNPFKDTSKFNKDKSPKTSSISIDGAKFKNGDNISKLKENQEKHKISSINSKSTIKVNSSANLKKIIPHKNSFLSSSTNFNKTISDKNKKLVDSYMIKYKGFCLGFVKDNDELKKLSDLCRINNIENFLEEYIFNNSVFQFKCEQMFLSKDANKAKKEKLIRDECKKLLENILLDLQVQSQINKINEKIDDHLKNIRKVEFITNLIN